MLFICTKYFLIFLIFRLIVFQSKNKVLNFKKKLFFFFIKLRMTSHSTVNVNFYFTICETTMSGSNCTNWSIEFKIYLYLNLYSCFLKCWIRTFNWSILWVRERVNEDRGKGRFGVLARVRDGEWERGRVLKVNTSE